MTVYQNSLMALFKKVVSFLEDNNINYIAACGTVLGAIRHHGFIPWDDDIDIYMNRCDYNKLLEKSAELNKISCEVCSVDNEGYYLPFVKIIDKTTTLWELKQFPFLIGNFIDVFPLDSFDCSDEDINSIQRNSISLFYDYQATVTKENIIDAAKYLFTGHKTSMIRALRHSLYCFNETKLRRKKLNAIKEYESTYITNNGSKSVCVYMFPGKVFKTEWFKDTIKVPFEDIEIVVPQKFDEYLTCLYGDWQTPPPPNKRNSKHDYAKYYFNLNERLSIEEVKLRINKGERLVI